MKVNMIVFLTYRPIVIYGERFEIEYKSWDPKDGELFTSRGKPFERVVDARSDTDVQIVRRTCV